MIQFLNAVLRDAAPLTLVTLGGVFAWRAGIFHLGLEGLMIIASFTAVAVAIKTGSLVLAAGAAIAVDLVVSAVFWWLIVRLRANPIIAGLGITIVGVGGTAFLLQPLFQTQGSVQTSDVLPDPIEGTHHGIVGIAANLSIVAWLVPLIVLGSWLVLRRSRYGLRIAVSGEYPFAARSAGINVERTRLQALLICGFLCGLGGTDFVLGNLGSFSQNITNGRGFIAFAAVIFGAGGPVASSLAASFFSVGDAAGIEAQLGSLKFLPVDFVLMIPYVLTILAVVVAGLLRRVDLDTVAGFNELRD